MYRNCHQDISAPNDNWSAGVHSAFISYSETCLFFSSTKPGRKSKESRGGLLGSFCARLQSERLQRAEGSSGRSCALKGVCSQAVKGRRVWVLVCLSQTIHDELAEDFILGANEVRVAEGHTNARRYFLPAEPTLSPPWVGPQRHLSRRTVVLVAVRLRIPQDFLRVLQGFHFIHWGLVLIPLPVSPHSKN